MDIFILKEQLGHILQAWFSSVLGVKGLPLIVCDMAFSKPNSESVRKKKILLALFSYYVLLLGFMNFHTER